MKEHRGGASSGRDINKERNIDLVYKCELKEFSGAASESATDKCSITHFSYRTISGSHIVSEGTLMEVIPP